MMHQLIKGMLPENQPYATHYLLDIWKEVTDLTYSVKDMEGPDLPSEKFAAFEHAREKRLKHLKHRLEDLRYNIDSTETVYLVSGRRRIEKVSRFKCQLL